MRTAPVVAAGFALAMASFADVYAAVALPASESASSATHDASTARRDFVIEFPFLLVMSAMRGDHGADGDPVHAVVTHELRVRDRVVVARARHDPHARPHERVRLVEVLRRRK